MKCILLELRLTLLHPFLKGRCADVSSVFLSGFQLNARTPRRNRDRNPEHVFAFTLLHPPSLPCLPSFFVSECMGSKKQRVLSEFFEQ